MGVLEMKIARDVLAAYDARSSVYPMFGGASMEVTTSEMAYMIQKEVAELRCARGERVCGFKLGMTSPQIRKQMGFSGPVRGYLWSSERYETGAQIHRSTFANLGLESEVAITLRSAINSSVLQNKEDLLDSIYAWHAAIELHDVSWQGYPSKQQLVSCNAFNSGIVLSKPSFEVEYLLAVQDSAPSEDITCELSADGTVLENAPFSEVPGGALGSLQWMVSSLNTQSAIRAAEGRQLQAGDVVLLGCPGKLLIPEPGARRLEARCGDLQAKCELLYDITKSRL